MATLEERARLYAEQAIEPLGQALGVEVPSGDMERIASSLAAAFSAGWRDACAGCKGLEAPAGMMPALVEVVLDSCEQRTVWGFISHSYVIGRAAYRDDQAPRRSLVDRLGAGRKGGRR